MTDSVNAVRQALDAAATALSALRANTAAHERIARAGDLLAEAFRNGQRALSCGNGGSMCDAMHFAEELTGKFRDERPGLPAVAIADGAHLSCVANDFGYENVFSRYVETHGRPGDVLLAISTSGASVNVVRAAAAAKAKGMSVISLTGRGDSALGRLADVDICTPADTRYSDRVQELHIKIIHTLIELVERALFSRT